MQSEIIISIISVLYMQGKDIFSPYNKPDILDDRIKDQNVTLEDQILVFLSCCQHMPTLDQLVQNKCPVTDFLPVSFSCQKYLNIRSVNRKHKRKGENWRNYKKQWRAKAKVKQIQQGVRFCSSLATLTVGMKWYFSGFSLAFL